MLPVNLTKQPDLYCGYLLSEAGPAKQGEKEWARPCASNSVNGMQPSF